LPHEYALLLLRLYAQEPAMRYLFHLI